MAFLYQTVISTGINKFAAQELCAFFDGRTYSTPLGSFPLRAFLDKSAYDESTIVIIYTLQHGESGTGSIDEAIICSFMHYGVYNDLRIIHLYFDNVNSGYEINDVITNDFILNRQQTFADPNYGPYDGCVISKKMYNILKQPPVFIPFGRNHYWRPYKGIDFIIHKSEINETPTNWIFLDNYRFQ